MKTHEELLSMGWKTMETAPKGNEFLLLLLKEDETTSDALDDVCSGEYSRSIGFNNFENDDVDEWRCVGWDWCHDEFKDKVCNPSYWMEFPYNV
jgi:hypothetical protein